MKPKNRIILFTLAGIALATMAWLFFPAGKKLFRELVMKERSREVLTAAATGSPAPVSASTTPPAIPIARPPKIPAPPPASSQPVSEPRVIALHLEDFDQRILVAPKEIINVQIDGGPPDNSSLKIEAPNGGSINGRKAPALVPAGDARRGIQFAVGSTRGLYTLEVAHAGQNRIFEFWVGEESPVGQPGPERTFTP